MYIGPYGILWIPIIDSCMRLVRVLFYSDVAYLYFNKIKHFDTLILTTEKHIFSRAKSFL